ncbi:MAG: hypothetical protein AAGF12_10650 [Myxococcota bacterium]
MRIAIAAFLVVLAAGCQSKFAGMMAMCDAPIHCAECMNAPPDMRATFLAAHIEEEVSNDEVLEMFQALAHADAATRRDILRQESGAVGIANCELAEMFEPAEPEPAEP